jgi:hypothetical protein
MNSIKIVCLGWIFLPLLFTRGLDLTSFHSSILVYSKNRNARSDKAAMKSLNQKIITLVPPFQGRRNFCSDESKQTYSVIIRGHNVTISYGKVSIKGIVKNGLLFTNDPKEIAYRHNAGKYNYGKYYVLEPAYFSVLNSENGEYRFYKLCK